MKKIHYTFVSKYEVERQLFEGTCNGKYFSARFGEYMLVITFKGDEHTFLESDGWAASELKRKAIIEEFLEWA